MIYSQEVKLNDGVGDIQISYLDRHSITMCLTSPHRGSVRFVVSRGFFLAAERAIEIYEDRDE